MTVHSAGPVALARGIQHCVHEAARAAYVQVRACGRGGEHGGEVEALPGIAVVDVEAGAIVKPGRVDPLDERHAIGRARAVVHVERHAGREQSFRHAEDRRDADPAREQQVVRSVGGERKLVARHADPHGIALPDFVVDRARPAAAIGIAQHGDLIAIGVFRVIAQRVLAHEPARQMHVDVGAGFKARQR